MRYTRATTSIVSSERNVREMYILPQRSMSSSERTDTREESLSIDMNSFPMAGSMTFTVCGRMMYLNACVLVSPRAIAASICPFGIAWIPALTISPMYAPKQTEREMMAAMRPSTWKKRPTA